jgi:hypothetical protein
MSLTLVILFALAVVSGVLAAAEPKPATDPKTGLDPKVLESMQPGPEHQRLATLAGAWDVTCSLWMSPEAPAMQSRGSATYRVILDGRFVQADFTGSFQGKPFTGLSLLGYDKAAKRHISTWCDSMATNFVCLSGTSTDDGRTITYRGEMICPQLGRTEMRQVETREQDDRFTIVMYQTPEGRGEFKSMELTYQRRR